MVHREIVVMATLLLSCEGDRNSSGNVFDLFPNVRKHYEMITPGNFVKPGYGTSNHLSNKKVYKYKPVMPGLDLPLDAFNIHHPFSHSRVIDLQYSQWYFLFFTYFDTSSASITMNVSLAVPEIRKSLSSKLSVPSSLFSILNAEKYRTKSISANLSLTNHTIPRLHHRLCNLQNTSPLFWIRGTRYKLVQVIHDKNQHLYLGDNGQV